MITTGAGVGVPASVVADEGGQDTSRRRLLRLLPVGLVALADVPAARTALLFPYLGLGSEVANQTVASEFCAVAETAYGTVYTHCAPTQLDRTPGS